MVSLVKHQSVPLVCFNGSYIESCSSFMIHDFIQVYRLLFGIHVAFFQFWDPGDGVLPIMAPPERGTFFRLQLYERVGILLVVVYERVGKSVISVCEMPKRPNRWILWIIKSGKRYIFVIDSYWNDNAFTAVQKEMQSSYQGMWKGFHLSKTIIRKGYVFREKWCIKG